MPYQVLHTLWSAQPGFRSFSRIVSGLASGLDSQRYRIHACFLDEGGPVVSQLQAAGAQVHVLGWRGARRDPVGTWRFWKILRSEKWAIIHLHAAGRMVRWLARTASRGNVILHLHARNSNDIEPRGYRPAPRSVWGADAIIATSKAVAEVAVGVRPYVVYPGVRVPEFRGCPPVLRTTGGRLIGTACRLVPIKGLVYLIRAMALLHTQFPDLSLEIAGLGPQQARLEEEARSLGLADHVRFLGWQMDVEAQMARWDIFAMPSLEEGFGIAALEAMAVGLPVVATMVGGVPELVENGRTGWLVPPADPAALAERLRALLLSMEQRLAMGSAGRSRARQHFSMDRMVAEIAKIYDNILCPP